MAKRRIFGTIRKLKSGRYQASYIAPNRVRYNAPFTFITKGDGDAWLSRQYSDLTRGIWIEPESPSKVLVKQMTVVDYVKHHIEVSTTRDGELLEASTKSLYGRLLRLHLTEFSETALAELTKPAVDLWFSTKLATGKKTTVAKAYGLLSAACARAVEDELILKNPCRIKGGRAASTGKKIDIPEPREIARLTHSINPRFKYLPAFAAYSGLRWGELTELRKKDFTKVERDGHINYLVSVSRAVKFVDGKFTIGKPKTKYSIRTVPITHELTEFIDEMLSGVPGRVDEALIFPSASGTHLRHDVFMNALRVALKNAGITRAAFAPHSFRHFGGTMYALSGATLPEIKKWLGDNSTDAVQIYLHATERTNSIANQMKVDFAISSPELLK